MDYNSCKPFRNGLSQGSPFHSMLNVMFLVEENNDVPQASKSWGLFQVVLGAHSVGAPSDMGVCWTRGSLVDLVFAYEAAWWSVYEPLASTVARSRWSKLKSKLSHINKMLKDRERYALKKAQNA